MNDHIYLSDRQLEVFHLIVRGLSNREIATTLNLSEGTVKIHVSALYTKLGVRRRAAVAIAGARFLVAQQGQTQPFSH